MFLFSVFILLILEVESLKILFIQTSFTKSHITFSNGLTALLARRGHIVDQIILDFNPPTFTGDENSRNIHRIAPEQPGDYIKMYATLDPLKHFYGELSNSDYVNYKSSFCEALLDRTDLIEKFRKEKYDLGVSTLVSVCGFGLFHLLDLPAWVGYSPMQNYAGLPYLFGIPQPYVMSQEIFDLTFPLFPTFDYSSIFQRIANFINRLRLDFFVTPEMWIGENEVFQRKFPDFPPLQTLYAKMNYAFLGTSQILDRPRPISAKIKYVGGIHRTEVKPLSQEFDQLLNNKSSVLFSFGAFSNTSNLPREVKRSIAKAFSRFPNHIFLWKFSNLDDDREFFADKTNIFRSNWLPQNDLLHDPRLKAVITHVGQNSYYEIAAAGKPIIAIPLFVDQYYNAACAIRNGVAYHVDKTKLNEETVYKALKEVLENPSYSKRATFIARALASSPLNGSKEFLDWIEYAAAFPGVSDIQTLDSSGMSLIKYLSIDVISILTLIVIFFVFIVKIVIMFIYRKICRNRNKERRIKKLQ